jgi:mannose-6-phosphate isomerase-like protein (cupin superfamily)
VVDIKDSELCCGSAGVYNLTEPAMAEELGRMKVARIRESGARMVTAGNPGCLLQIARHAREAGLDLEVGPPGGSSRARPEGHMKVRIEDHVKFDEARMAKIALATTGRCQLDLYCVAPGQSQRPHTHGDQDKIYFVLEGSAASLWAARKSGWGRARRWWRKRASSTASSTTATSRCSSWWW